MTVNLLSGTFRRFLMRTTAVAVAMVLCASCIMEPTDNSGGTGSEIVGKAAHPDSAASKRTKSLQKMVNAAGLPVIGGKIFVYPRTFIPDTSWATVGALPRVTTDANGNFRVLDVPRGEVVVEANDGRGSGIVKTIVIDKDSTVYDAGVLTVRKSGALTIQAKTALPGRVRFYVSVKGTRCVVRGTSAGVDIALGDIPSGIAHTVNIRVYEPIMLETNITNVVVPAGGSVALRAFVIQ